MEIHPQRGILSYIEGATIAQGIKQLPPAGDGSPETAETIVDTDDLGRVLIRYQRKKARRHKSSHWFWSAVWAGRVES